MAMAIVQSKVTNKIGFSEDKNCPVDHGAIRIAYPLLSSPISSLASFFSVQTPPIEVKEFFARRRTIQAFYDQYGGLTVYRSVNHKDADELLFLVSPTEGLKGLLKKRAACKSPHIARVLEIGKVEDTSHPYWVCALDLASKYDELLSEQQHRPRRICELLIHVARGISVLHSHGLYHGDIRAGNVWVRINGSQEEAFLVGVAIDQWAGVMSSSSPTVEQARYMAPERTMGEVSSFQTDIYSFAVLVYRSLSGSYPFDGTEPFSITAAHATEEVPTPVPPFDPPLWELLSQCLDKEPSHRPKTIQSCIDLLEEYARGDRNIQNQTLQGFSSEDEPTPSIPIQPEPELVIEYEEDIRLSEEVEWGAESIQEPILPEEELSYPEEPIEEPSLVAFDETSQIQSPVIQPEKTEEIDHVAQTMFIQQEVTQKDMDSDTVHTLDYSESQSYEYSGLETDTHNFEQDSEDFEDITVVPAKVQLEPDQDALDVPNLRQKAIAISPAPIVQKKPPKISLDEISPMSVFEDTKEDEEEQAQTEEHESLDLDIKKYILFGIFCFVLTLIIIVLVKN